MHPFIQTFQSWRKYFIARLSLQFVQQVCLHCSVIFGNSILLFASFSVHHHSPFTNQCMVRKQGLACYRGSNTQHDQRSVVAHLTEKSSFRSKQSEPEQKSLLQSHTKLTQYLVSAVRWNWLLEKASTALASWVPTCSQGLDYTYFTLSPFEFSSCPNPFILNIRNHPLS